MNNVNIYLRIIHICIKYSILILVFTCFLLCVVLDLSLYLCKCDQFITCIIIKVYMGTFMYVYMYMYVGMCVCMCMCVFIVCIHTMNTHKYI